MTKARITCFSLFRDDLERLGRLVERDLAAGFYGVNRSSVIRRALAEYEKRDVGAITVRQADGDFVLCHVCHARVRTTSHGHMRIHEPGMAGTSHARRGRTICQGAVRR